MRLDITPACDSDYTIITNLARFYIYDMSEYTGWNFPADGLFDAENQFANYWGRPGKRTWPQGWLGFPFLIRLDAHPAGFALVKRICDAPPTFDMGEFFIARSHRGQGIGRRVAQTLFDRLPGRWEIREMPANQPAQAFWRRTIAAYTGGAFTETQEVFAVYDNREFVVQRFETVASAGS
jgi:ribosomal-protein-alanine N-acetyltransferase